MAQYCRYCSWFCTGNGNYCEKKNICPTDSYAKHPNSCMEFDLNPVDAFFESKKEYVPRKRVITRKSEVECEQLSLFK